ncbi:MAG TPA: GatB/YqeY domain-containing protein, partial [Flavisolibacter sp.]
MLLACPQPNKPQTTNHKPFYMRLEQQIMAEMKDAMKAKDEAALRGLRAIKAEIIKAKTEPGAGGEITADKELSVLQKMV